MFINFFAMTKAIKSFLKESIQASKSEEQKERKSTTDSSSVGL